MLCPPDGSTFISPGLDPNQSIKRFLNPEWDSAIPLRAAKFLLDPVTYDGIPFRSLFDLVGLFISSIGYAPHHANARSFYLPLTAMYGKWCTTLGDTAPTVFNCTWITAGNDQDRFFLGASLEGYKDIHRAGEWTEAIMEARFSLINDTAVRTSGYKMYDCPLALTTGKVYPLIHISKQNINPVTHGITLHKRGLFPAKYEDHLSGKIWSSVKELCANCRELIRMWGGFPANFNPMADAEGAPP
ncbi:hypothetical protein N7517_007415 [Penicillium concentricum]|uniref:Uncharacterized protein n=1 Tax=Penicillium concentricum TaxID=293559 RepID=A0A9W9SDV1_9EURO|nr:uncharacterized protein N7517_007415 [Penicillium concentricum]KAJ5375409.1 hypothetical protein N7517_007415 [Penicillium concentricum]